MECGGGVEEPRGSLSGAYAPSETKAFASTFSSAVHADRSSASHANAANVRRPMCFNFVQVAKTSASASAINPKAETPMCSNTGRCTFSNFPLAF